MGVAYIRILVLMYVCILWRAALAGGEAGVKGVAECRSLAACLDVAQVTPKPKTRKIQPSTLSHQYSTLNPQPSTLNAQP